MSSWLDRLIKFIHRLPGPAWLYYIGLYVTGTVILNIGRWASGQLPLGRLDLISHSSVVWAVYMLVMVDYLKRTATSSLAAFRPALQVDDAEYAQLAYRLTNTPRGATLFASLTWFTLGTVAYFIAAPFVHPSYAPWEIIALAVPFLLAGAAIYHTIHQLRMVSYIHSRVQSVNLFHLVPLYAFSRLTVRTAISWIVISYGSLLLLPRALSLRVFSLDFSFALLLLVYILYTVMALAAFILPLIGIHRQIAAEKERQQEEVNQRLERVIRRIYQEVGQDSLDGADGTNKTLNSLLATRTLLEQVPTWPWQSGTLRALATTILLPLALWIIQQLLSRYIGA